MRFFYGSFRKCHSQQRNTYNKIFDVCSLKKIFNILFYKNDHLLSQTLEFQQFIYNRLKKKIKFNFKCFNYLFNISIGKINYPVDIII